MEIFFFLFSIALVKSAPFSNLDWFLGICEGSLQLGEDTLNTSNEDVTDTSHMTGGLKVLGCGSWVVYSKTGRQGDEACIDASHGKMNINDIGLQRVRSVYRRKTPCPKRAKRSESERTCENGLIWSLIHKKCIRPILPYPVLLPYPIFPNDY